MQDSRSWENALIETGPLRTRLPRRLELEPTALDAYWDRLGRAGLRGLYGAPTRFGRSECLYGTALDISPELADHLVGAVRVLDGLMKQYIRDAGGVGAWLEGRAPTFGGVPLSFDPINARLEQLLFAARPEDRSILPFSLDCILTIEGGRARLSAVELQSGIDYTTVLWDQLEALGYDSGSRVCWRGTTPPRAVVAEVRRTLARGEDVSVLGSYPSLHGNLPDEAGLAALLSADGRPRGYFLPGDLRRDAEGWYHAEYPLDPADRLPLMDARDQRLPGRDGSPRRIRHMITMQTQNELDEIHERLSAPERAQFLEFLSDASVGWILPHAGWYLADKSTMIRYREDLTAQGSPYADLFVPCYGSGRRAEAPGSYVVKPVRGVGGKGIRVVEVEPGTSFVVPDEHLAQKQFKPYPFPVRLPEALAGAFPSPPGAPGPRGPRWTTGTVELRVLVVPGSTERSDAYLFLGRVAPTWDPADPGATTPVLTNLGKIQSAVWNSAQVTMETWRYVPFGWFVVTVGATE